MRKSALFSVLVLSSFVLGQDLNPAVIQQISKLSKQELQDKLKQQQDSDTKKAAKAISETKNAQDLTLQTDAERIRLLQDIEKQKKKDSFFGESFFKFAQVIPKTFGPVPDSYKLGAGDELVITLYGEVQLSFELTLDRENNIFPEEIGRINLGGVTFVESKKILRDRFSKSYSTLRGRNARTKMHVTVGRHRKIHVSVLGEVKKPQNHILSSLNSVFDAVVLSGGPTKNAAIRQIEIKRGNTVIHYDLYADMIPSVKAIQETLEDGDIIYVSNKKNTIDVAGGVRLEGEYEISQNSTALEMVNIAGGITRFGSEGHIDIATIINDKLVSLSFSSVEERNKHILKNGDKLTINKKLIADSSSVEIIGSVLYPGEYPFIEGNTYADYVKLAGGYKEHTYKKRFELLKKKNPKEFASTTLSEAEVNTTQIGNGDVLQVFSELDFIETRQVYVVSYQQGLFTFDYFENAHIYDYIAKIGGIKHTEDNSFIEVVRLSENDASSYAKEYKIKIDKDYLNVSNSRKNAFSVHPDDIIIIRKNPSYEEFQTVKVYGEVKSVGSYPIVKKDERVSEILKRTSGLRNSAYVDGIKFLRPITKDFSLINDSTYLDGKYLRIPIDFHSVLNNSNHEDNIAVFDGDSIHVPKNPYTVLVQGEVNTPKAVVFVTGQSADYYLAQAGGLSAYADGDRIQIIKANGKQFDEGLFSSDKINAGSVITVPREKAEDESASIINTIFQSVSAIVTTLVLIKQL